MDNISNLSLKKLVDGRYVKPYQLTYSQNEVPKIWELVSVHPSVSILIFNTDRKKLVLVKQFRPAVYFSNFPREEREKYLKASAEFTKFPKIPAENALTIELCAGIVDKSSSLNAIAKAEVLEECGYDVPLASLQEVITYRTGVGMEGERQTFFYVEVTDAMRVNQGGGLEAEGEMIDVVEMSIEEIKNYIESKEVCSPGGLLFGVMWFLTNKAHLHTK